MKRTAILTLGVAMLALGGPAAAGPSDDLTRLLDDHWKWTLKESPIFASSVGVRDYDTQLGDISLAAEDRRVREAQALLARLNAIPEAGLSPQERTNRLILKRQLEEQIEGNKFGQRMILFNSRGSMHSWLASLGDQLPFRSKADYSNYLERLSKFPALNEEAIRISTRAVAEGYNQPCVAMQGFEQGITGVITADPAQSRFYRPFTRPKPADATDAEWAALQARARSLVTDTLNPAYRRFADFYTQTVAPKCSRTAGVSAQPNGAAYYAFQVRNFTTTNLTPDQIHQIGLSEVARIRAEMEQVATRAGFPTREAFIQDLRTNPKHYPKTPEELMMVASRIAKIIDGKMPSLFHHLPRLPYGLREVPAEMAERTTTAYYQPGSAANGIAGFYFVNTSKLDQRPLWEMPALTVHEAVPGHHHQIAIQQELDMPPLRRHLAFFTAFVEGWGLYSERLGIEMGIYDTPEKEMGRLSYEMWRACRLVVDTGIHSKGWTKEQAVRFMTDNTALTAANIDAEVNRYISWPGQALAYKIGELRIRELRTKAEQALGPRFDLAGFHDVVLGQGALPLDVLETNVNTWIRDQLATAQ